VVLEVAILNVKPDQGDNFERAFREASAIVSTAGGYVSHELGRCLEQPDKYVLLVRWQSVEAHTMGFRQSRAYEEWKRLLHHFYDPFPTVEHYLQCAGGDPSAAT